VLHVAGRPGVTAVAGRPNVWRSQLLAVCRSRRQRQHRLLRRQHQRQMGRQQRSRSPSQRRTRMQPWSGWRGHQTTQVLPGCCGLDARLSETALLASTAWQYCATCKAIGHIAAATPLSCLSAHRRSGGRKGSGGGSGRCRRLGRRRQPGSRGEHRAVVAGAAGRRGHFGRRGRRARGRRLPAPGTHAGAGGCRYQPVPSTMLTSPSTGATHCEAD
jgi:hypothetical protein